jgi:ribonuclease HII
MAPAAAIFNLPERREACHGRAVGWFIGADENGLGPRLGPMVVTAVLARAEPGAEGIIGKKPRGGLAQRLGDSKGLVSHGDIALGEAWARALVERGAGKQERGASIADLVRAVSLDEPEALQAPCPSHVHGQCWSTEGEGFVEAEEMGDRLKLVRRDLGRLADRGLEVVAVRSVVVCTKRLNEAVARGQSRFVVDLHAMERLILALREIAGEALVAECGKVGGFGQYGKVFGPLGGRLHAVLEEGRARSAYHFPGIGEIAFVRDSDASNILVGMASLVGKYLREVLMSRIVRHYRRHDADLPTVSGYHDPITDGFVVATEALRRAHRVPGACFERDKLGNETGAIARGRSASAE